MSVWPATKTPWVPNAPCPTLLAPPQASNPAIANALLVGAALLCGAALLVQKGRLTWPPYQLLSSLSTLAGCLALVGPLILIRSGEIEGSLGELLWLTGGLLVWFFDIEAVMQGRWKTMPWATPLSRPNAGPGDPGGAAGRLEMRAGRSKLVVDQCHRLASERVLGRDGVLLVVPRPRLRAGLAAR